MISHYRDCELILLKRLFMERFRGAAALDIGCGDGRNLPLMKAAGCAVTGVDTDSRQAKGFEDGQIRGVDW